MNFTDKVVVITGASRGIGKEIALRFGQKGAKVACIATSEPRARPVVDLIEQEGGVARSYGCDVSEASQVEEVFSKINHELGVPSVLVNNAGIVRDNLLVRLKDEDWNRVLDVNLKGAFHCIRSALKGMMKARYGRIVNISSIVGMVGGVGQANYAASKGGLIALSQSVAKELGARGITCNAVAPGFTETDMTDDLLPEAREHLMKRTAVGRVGTPADIAPLVLFLASEEAGYITGQAIAVDGGLTLAL